MSERNSYTFTVPPWLRKQIEDYRFERRCQSLSLALRRLIQAGLKAEREAALRRHVEEAVDGRR